MFFKDKVFSAAVEKSSHKFRTLKFIRISLHKELDDIFLRAK